MRTLASQLQRSPSTISREIKRNGGYDNYRATQADQAAWDRACRPKLCKLAYHPSLSRKIASKLMKNWSPEQIAGWLKKSNPNNENSQVSHETIYRSLFIQTRGVLKKELQQYLRTQRAISRSKHASLKKEGLGKIKDAVSMPMRLPEGRPLRKASNAVRCFINLRTGKLTSEQATKPFSLNIHALLFCLYAYA